MTKNIKKNTSWLFIFFITSIFIMNISDTFFTIFWYSNHMMTELNPLMNIILQKDLYLFAVIKITLVSLGSLFFILNYPNRLTLYGSGICFGALFIINYHHVVNGLPLLYM